MSANPADLALERLNYFNGQRLAASDFRAEQGHHIGMRRVLNQSLYSSGVVTGLEVDPDKTNKHRVIVRRGLAFDHLGREIFLPDDVYVTAMGVPSTRKGIVFGNLLVISYRDQRTHTVSDGCSVPAPCTACNGDLAWGAPTRITAQTVFEFLDSWPADDSGKIPLAQLDLSRTCEVQGILPGVRKYAMPVKPQQVRGVSIEGEKNIDRSNPKVLYFHVTGGYPEAVALYLRGLPFSSLFYTELGKHNHGISFDSGPVTRDLSHVHTVTAGATSEDGEHTHSFIVDDGETKGGIDVNDTDLDMVTGENPIKPAGKHTHTLSGIAMSNELGPAWKHDHHIGGNTHHTGATDENARVGKPALDLIRDLRISLDGQSITEAVCDQLESKPGQAGKWKVLIGTDVRLNGASLSTGDGTGEIDLLRLGIEIGLGQHKLELGIPDADVGGNLQYNLYVS